MKTEEITIESLAYGGDGVAHLQDGRAAFIAGALPGDTVLARISEDKERFVKGEVDQLAEASPDRVTPPCALAAAGRCGGCPWATLSYEKQLFWKRQAVVDAFSRIAKYGDEAAEALVGACVASPKQWNYRNKVEFEVGQDVAGRFTLGMHARGGSFVPLAECKLCAKKLEKAPRVLTGSLRYTAGTLDLGIERVGIRTSERTKDVEVALWTSPGRFPRANVARVVSDGLPVKRPGVTRVLIKGDAKRRKVVGVESLAGHGCWSERIGDYKMLLSAPSFFQVNTPNAEKLVELALEGLAVDGLDSVLDLYSGAGTFTLPLAERAQSVAAVEMEGSCAICGATSRKTACGQRSWAAMWLANSQGWARSTRSSWTRRAAVWEQRRLKGSSTRAHGGSRTSRATPPRSRATSSSSRMRDMRSAA